MKKNIAFSLLVGLMGTVVFYGNTTANSLTFSSISQDDPIRNSFSPVHFTLPDETVNNFQGGFFRLPARELARGAGIGTKASIAYNGQTKECGKQLRGLYYSNAKGERLFPIDNETLVAIRRISNSYDTLTIEGGLYTSCGNTPAGDASSIYGHIIFRDGGQQIGTLSAGLIYDAATNSVDTSNGFRQSFQYFNNLTPLGYIYDSEGGVGFVGGLFPTDLHVEILDLIKNNNRSINNIFQISPTGTFSYSGSTIGSFTSAGLDTLWNISVMGNVLLTRGGIDETSRRSVLGNQNRNSSVMFSDVLNTSDILNNLRKNAQSICRGLPKITDLRSASPVGGKSLGDLIAENDIKSTDRAVCVYNGDGGTNFLTDLEAFEAPLVIDLTQPQTYQGRDIIVQGRNVVLYGGMPSDEFALSLFVDNGNILLYNEPFHDAMAGGSHNDGGGGAFLMFNGKGEVYYETAVIAKVLDNVFKSTRGTQTDPTFLPSEEVIFQGTKREQANLSDIDVFSPGDTQGFQRETVNAYTMFDVMKNGSNYGVQNIDRVFGFGLYLRGNIFANGLIMGCVNPTSNDPRNCVNPGPILNKYYVHGRLASLNTALEPSEPRIQLISRLFGDSNGERGFNSNIKEFIAFSNAFEWTCDPVKGLANVGENEGLQQPCRVGNDVFKNSPLILINTNVSTRLLD